MNNGKSVSVVLALANDESFCTALLASLPDGCHLIVERNLDDALTRMISIEPDAVLVNDSGKLVPESIQVLRKQAPDVPLIVLTDQTDVESWTAFSVAGAHKCISKPIDAKELQDAIWCGMASEYASEHKAIAGPSRVASAPAGPVRQQAVLRWVHRHLVMNDDPQRISEALIEGACDIFDAARAALVMQVGQAVRVVASHGLKKELVRSMWFDPTRGLMRWLELHPAMVHSDSPVLPASAKKEMSLLGARLAVPILNDGRVEGALLLGDHALGLEYGPEECELLSLVAKSASACLEKAARRRSDEDRHVRVDHALASLREGVVTIRPDRTISTINPAAARILQVNACDVLGKSVQKLGSSLTDLILRVLLSHEPRRGEEVFEHAAGKTLDVDVTPMGNHGVVAVFTERCAQEALPQDDLAYSPVWEHLAERTAQEIKNPMVAINTFAQLLPKKYDSKEFREEFSKVVQEEISRINGVVETIFDFAKRPRPDFRSSDLNRTVRWVLEAFEDELSRRSIVLETKLDTGQLNVILDPELFSKAIGNVVQNSIDAMPNGGTLKVMTSRSGESHDLVIADTGPGISDHDAPLVFQPFFSTKERGMGLGLTVANRILEQHRGKLELLNRGKSGGAFVFHLPMAM